MEIDPKEVGDYLRAVHKELYGNAEMTGIFNGGNVGLMAVAMAINNHAKTVDRLTSVIEREVYLKHPIKMSSVRITKKVFGRDDING